MTAPRQTDHKATLEASIRRERMAIVVMNTRSRKARQTFDEAQALLTQRGVTIVAAHAVTDPSALQSTVRAAVAAHDCTLIVVGGGDGTISEVVDCLALGDRVLGLLPLGTSNNFARTLGIPLTLDAAIDVILTGKVADVDLGQVDGDYFANVASLGLTARVAGQVPHWAKRHLGRLGYALTGVMAIASQSPFEATLTVDGITHRMSAHQIVIANGRFHAGRPITADASADDRQLSVQVIATRHRWQLIRVLLAYFAGRGDEHPGTLALTGSELTLDCTPAQQLEVDGELKASTPVRIQVAEEALTVVVPQSFDDR